MTTFSSNNTPKEFRNLNPKRNPSSKIGIESWYPYYAGYTKKFAEDVVTSLRLQKQQVLLDPWNGSGTTTYVGNSFGISSLGIDINPVAVLVASAKLVRSADAYHYRGIIEEIINQADKSKKTFNAKDDALEAWMSPAALEYFRKLQDATIRLLAQTPSGGFSNPLQESLPPLAAFLMLSLIKAARTLVNPRKSTNPTWVRPDVLPRIHKTQLKKEFLESASALCRDISQEFSSDKNSNSKVFLGDARNMHFIENGSIDGILTSPPYCTRIDYAINTSFELAALGISEKNEDFNSLRKKLTGTTLIRNDLPNAEDTRVPAIEALLKKIKKHDSKASSVYYFKNYKQYFDDMTLSINEISRVLKPQSPAVLVLQNSYYKEINIDLPKLIAAIGKEVGLRGKVVKRIEVSKALSTINPLRKKYLDQRKYFESILLLEKT